MAETRVTVKADVKGFVEANRAAAKISKTAATAAKDQLRNTKDVEKELGRLQGRLKDVTRHQVAMNQAMDKVGKGTREYKLLTGQLRELTQQQTTLERSARGVERAFKSQAQAGAVTAKEMARGGLLQGLVQGAMPGAFIQRGPGMRRQIVGMGVGRMARGVAGGLGAMPFQGLGGLAQALQSIPGGGFLAAPLMAAAQASGSFLQMQRVGLGTMPLLGGAAAPENMAAYRGRVARARAGAMEGYGAGNIAIAASQAQAQALASAAGPSAVKAAQNKAFIEHQARMAAVPGMKISTFTPSTLVSKEAAVTKIGVKAFAAKTASMEKERASRLAKAMTEVRKTRPGYDITTAGVELLAGGAPEARQLAAQISQAGGGVGAEMARRTKANPLGQDMTRTAFAAKTLYGVGADVSGAFLQAGRRGGAVGAQGRSSEAMADAIGDAVGLKLEGSELNDYLSQIAGGITSWKDTGIPINAKSIGEISMGMAGLGLGGLRGSRVGAGIARAAQGVAAGGIRGAGDLLMMQTLGGYRGGGAAQYEQAKMTMEEMEFGPKQVEALLKRVLATGGQGEEGRAIGRGTLQRYLGSRGVQVGTREMMIVSKRLRKEPLSEKEQTLYTKWEKQAEAGGKEAAKIRDPQALAERAAKAIDLMAPNLKRQAIMANDQLIIGGRMVTTMQNLEEAQQNLANTFSKVTAPMLTDMSVLALDLTNAVEDLVSWIKDKIGDDAKLESTL